MEQEFIFIDISEKVPAVAKGRFQAAELIWMSYMQAGFMGVKL